jgi:hypothetical protein
VRAANGASPDPQLLAIAKPDQPAQFLTRSWTILGGLPAIIDVVPSQLGGHARKCGGRFMTFIPNDHDALLPRDKFAAALTEAGFPTSAKTLATKASRGGGPPFQKYGPRVLYRWRTGLAWAQSRLTPPRHSTSKTDAAP